jgi:hypothetical protein
MLIIQIVPKLPPAINGLGDYALNLARQLRQDFDIQTYFIVGDPDWNGLEEIEGFSVNKVENQSAKQLLSLLEQKSSETVLLHYSGYGYAQRGCPSWLIEGLKQWRNAINSRKLITMFHEIYAHSNKPWHSSFWLSSLQRKLAIELVINSDRLITNRQENAKILSKITKVRLEKIKVLPVFSNIGEPQKLIPFSQRKKHLVIFGHPNSKLQIYQNHLKHLENLVNILSIDKIYDIGTFSGFNFNVINNLQVIETGVLNVNDISQIFANSIAGFIAFPPLEYLAKSTIFASYCAYGLLPVVPFYNCKKIDGLEANQNYLAYQNPLKEISCEKAELIANNAYQWYQDHNISKQTKIFASYLNKTSLVGITNESRSI